MKEKLNEDELKEFIELKSVVTANGFMALDSKEKRDKYRELKGKYDHEFEKVEITKADLQTLLDDAVRRYKQEALKEYKETGIEEVKRFGEWVRAKQKKVPNNTAKLRVYRDDGVSEGGIVIDLKFKKNIFNESTRKYDDPLYIISVLYSTGQQQEKIKDHEIRLVDFVNINEFEEVEIIGAEETPQVLIQGQGQKATPKGGYFFSSPSYFGTKSGDGVGEIFDYIVTRRDIVYRVKRKNGDIIKIHSSKLNL